MATNSMNKAADGDKKEHNNEESELTQEDDKSKRNLRKKVRARKFPIWLRIIVVLILLILALITGLMVGYGVIGDGNPIDVLHKQTWQHIIDIVKKE